MASKLTVKNSEFLKPENSINSIIINSSNEGGLLKPISVKENSGFFNSKFRNDMLGFFENPFNANTKDNILIRKEEDGQAEWISTWDNWVSNEYTEFFTGTNEEGVKGIGDILSYVSDGLDIATDYTKKALEWANSFGLSDSATKKTIDTLQNPLTNYLTSLITFWMGGYGTLAGTDNFSSSVTTNMQEEKKEISNIDFTSKNTFANPVSLAFNKNVQKMIDAGPDLFTNSFDTFFLVESKGENSSFFPLQTSNLKFKPTPMESFLDNFSEISIRNSKISIPQRLSGTYDQKFLNESITNVNHAIEFENKAELSLDLDSNLLVIDLINNLTNLPNWICKIQDNDGAFTFDSKQSFSEENAQFFATSYNRGSGNFQLDIVVNSRSFNIIHSAFYNPNKETEVNNILYIFQNVRFLGTDSISFDRTSWSLQNKSFPFVFSSLFEVYKVTSDLKVDSDNKDGIIVHPIMMDNNSKSVREI